MASLNRKEKAEKTKKLNRYIDNVQNSKFKIFVGIDIALSCTGICIISNKKVTTICRKSDSTNLTIDRVIEIVYGITTALSMYNPKDVLIGIEKPFGIAGHGRILLELLGVVKYCLYRDDCQNVANIVEVPQSTLKKFATGKGNAQKSDMVKQSLKEYGVEAETEDEIDAFWCAKFVQAINKGADKKYRKDCITKFMKKFTI